MKTEIEFGNDVVYLPDSNTLVLSDLHYGFGYGRGNTVSTEKDNNEKISQKIENSVEKFKPKTVVFAGDIVEQFEGPTKDSIQSLQMIERIVTEENDSNLVVLSGNHDNRIINDTFDTAKTQNEWVTKNGKTTIFHGDTPPTNTDSNRYIFGHLHPTVKIDGNEWNCFLYTRLPDELTEILILPAFNPFVGGTNVGNIKNTQKLPVFSEISIESYHPIIWNDGGIKTFPPLKESNSFFS